MYRVQTYRDGQTMKIRFWSKTLKLKIEVWTSAVMLISIKPPIAIKPENMGRVCIFATDMRALYLLLGHSQYMTVPYLLLGH